MTAAGRGPKKESAPATCQPVALVMSWRLLDTCSSSGTLVLAGGGPASPFPSRLITLTGSADGAGHLRLAALLPDGALEVWERSDGDARRRIRCLKGARAADVCRFLASDRLLVVVTADGKALLVS